jgi:choline/glycine/proline betaine transport protein
LRVRHGESASDFVYAVRAVSHPVPAFALTDAAQREGERHRYYRAEVFLTHGGRGYDIFGYDTDQVIADVINHYDQFRHYLSATSSS